MTEGTEFVACIALGANLGAREQNLLEAAERLRNSAGIMVEAVSSFRSYAAVGGPAGSPPYLNAAAVLRTPLSARELLDVLLEIEADMGRVRRHKWEARVIDLDLLLYGDQVINEPGLIVPHPLMHERRFVLEPLAKVAPHAVHPVLGKRVIDLLDGLP